MARTRRVPLTILAALALATAAPSSLRSAPISPPFPSVGPALLLRLKGVIQTTSPAARKYGFTVASLGFAGTDAAERWLGVTDARTVGGDNPVNGKDVLAALSPFTPNLLVMGPPDLVARLSALPAGTTVTIEGLVDRGSRTYYLRRLQVWPEG